MTGIFDSGVGGLSVLRHLLRLAPRGDYVYLADTARIPYGSRSREEIIGIAKSDMGFLISKGVDALAAGCGTVSSVFPADEIARLPVPFCGAIAPAAEKAAQLGGRIVLLATELSVKSGRFARLVASLNPEAEVVGVACPAFVPLIEGGIAQNRDELRLAAARYLAEGGPADVVVLGCTHFPLISDIIAGLTDARVVDIGLEMALHLLPAVKEEHGRVRLYVSGDRTSFVRSSGEILGLDADPITDAMTWQ